MTPAAGGFSFPRSLRKLLIWLGVAALLLGVWRWRLLTPIITTDQEQARLNRGAPIPRGSSVVQQSFVAEHNGLSALEVLAVVYPSLPSGPLMLSVTDANGQTLASETFQDFTHNAPLRIQFLPQPFSAGQAYTLTVSAPDGNGATVWAYDLDGYARGQLIAGGERVPGDLRFSAAYTLLGRDGLRESLDALAQLGRHSLALWLVLFAPGLLVVSFVRTHWLSNRWARWGLALALSLSLAPLTWLWSSWAQTRWTSVAISVVYGTVGVLTIVRLVLRWRAGVRPSRWTWHDTLMLGILLIGWLARMLAIRDLAFPAWVDSPHHAIVSRLLAEAGQVPLGYRPVLPIDAFTYHFGFHTLEIAFRWGTGLSMPDSYLFLGQVLNGLMPLAMYTFVFALTARRGAALMAAFFVGWVSLFPAYYVSWGRYTQLTGLLILAPLLALTWRITRLPSGRPWLSLIVAALLASGVILTHYRVAAFFVVFALIALAAGRRRGWRWLLASAVLTAGLCAPWLWRLSQYWAVLLLQSPEQFVSAGGYNAFPVAYFQSVLERSWLAIAALGLLWGMWRRQRALWAVTGWITVTFALLNIGSGSWLVNNNSWAISLFVPGALAAGWGTDELWRQAHRLWQGRHGRFGRAIGMALGVCLATALAYFSLHGLRGQVAIVNPVTLLATTEDAEALAWVEANTSPEAVFWVNSWQWNPNFWSVPDGGAWLWPLLGRRTTMPPLDYNLQPDWFAEMNALNRHLSGVTEVDAPETLTLLKSQAVTHIFIGARGGYLKPEMFVHASHYRLVFTNGAAWVFEVIYP